MSAPIDSSTVAKNYAIRREAELPRLYSTLSQIYGIPHASITIDGNTKNNCKLTHDGVVILCNPLSAERLSKRIGYGVKGYLPMRACDLLIALHQVNNAVDFLDPTFFIEENTHSLAKKNARRYFNALIDDIAIDTRLQLVTIVSEYYDPFISRLVEHDLIDKPLHIQLLCALWIVLLEDKPQFSVHESVQEIIDHIKDRSGGYEEARTAFDSHISFEMRHRIADEYIFPCFLDFLKHDLREHDYYQLSLLYNEHNFFGIISDIDIENIKRSDDDLRQEYADELFFTTDMHVEQPAIDSTDNKEGVAEGEDDSSPGLILPRTGNPDEELDLADDQDYHGYHALRMQWHSIIGNVADILLRLSAPTESIAVPRYRYRRTTDGSRINQRFLAEANIQLQTGFPRPIWQPIEKQIKHQDLQFTGLDIYLLLDVSGSMGGENAHYAAAAAVCLIEGLQRARYRAESDPRQHAVDVRVQLLAFGIDWAELTPLCKELTRAQKETAYFNLMHPSSNFTLINGALKHVHKNSLLYRKRDVLALIISDGLFSDNLEAFKTVKSMPPNVYTGHISIGQSTGIPITLHHESVSDPRALPKKLESILSDYFLKIEASGGVKRRGLQFTNEESSY